MLSCPLTPQDIKETIIPYMKNRDTFIMSHNLKESIKQLNMSEDEIL